MSDESQLERGRDPTDEDSPISPQISSAIDKILANPEIISVVASALGGSNESKTPTESSESVETSAKPADTASKPTDTTDVMASLAPILSSLQGKSFPKPSPHQDRRACLLNALKPYLCRERCEAIDYMIKLGRISELFKNMI